MFIIQSSRWILVVRRWGGHASVDLMPDGSHYISIKIYSSINYLLILDRLSICRYASKALTWSWATCFQKCKGSERIGKCWKEQFKIYSQTPDSGMLLNVLSLVLQLRPVGKWDPPPHNLWPCYRPLQPSSLLKYMNLHSRHCVIIGQCPMGRIVERTLRQWTII